MVLFCMKNIQDSFCTLLKVLVKLSNTAGIFPQKICKLYRVTERVNLKLPLPYPWILIRIVFFPAGAVRLFIKRIGISVYTDIKKLPSHQTCDQFFDLLIIFCRKNILSVITDKKDYRRKNVIGNSMKDSQNTPMFRYLQRYFF